MDKEPNTTPPRFRPRVVLGLVVALFAVSGILATAAMVRRDRDATLQQVEWTASDVARLLAEHARRTIDPSELAMRWLAGRVAEKGLAGMASPGEWLDLASFTAGLPQAGPVWLVDRQGGPVLGTGMPPLPLPEAESGIVIGPALPQGGIDGPVRFTLSQPLRGPSGAVAGSVVAAIAIDYFRDFYRRLDFGPQASYGLYREDGMVLVRQPPPSEALVSIGHLPLFREHVSKAPYGATFAVSRIDGVARIAAWRRVEGLPLVVVAALSVEDSLAAWEDRATRAAALLAGGLLALALLARAGFAGLAREERIRYELERANSVLERLSSSDALLGIANRRTFDITLQAESRRVRRQNTPLALLMIDIDHFKSYNDSYGHPQGDEALRKVARAVEQALKRPSDLVARYGGEELAVLLPATDLAGALQVAWRIHRMVAAADILHEAAPLGRVTVSIGAAVLGAGAEECSASSLLGAADRSLYAAKRSGRARTVALAEEGAAPAVVEAAGPAPEALEDSLARNFVE